MDNPRTLVLTVRERHKLTQAELGRLMRRTGNYISMIERGDYVPSPSFMAHLALVDWILTPPEERGPSPLDDPDPKLALPRMKPKPVHPIGLNC